MNIHIVQNYYEHVYQAVHFDSSQSPVALFLCWGGGGGGVAPFPGSLTRGKKETGNVMADKPLTSTARNLAAPIRLRNDSCESMMRFAKRPSLVPRLSLPLGIQQLRYSQRRGMVADLSPEVLFIVHTGDSAVTTVTMESYMLFPFPQFFNALLMLCIRVM